MSSLGKFANGIDRVSLDLGHGIAWLALAMVLVQFAVVVLRYVFGINFIWMQESVTYMHALVFLVGAAYTLLEDGHVRVDVFYRDASPSFKAWVDLLGSLGFLIPISILILWSSWGYVATSWKVWEGSAETSGIQAVFLLKSVILVFGAMMLAQAGSLALHAVLCLFGVEGACKPSEHFEREV